MAPGSADAPGTASAAIPLQAAAAVGATLSKDIHTAEWNGQVSSNSFHVFVNETSEPLELSWGDELRDNPYGTVQPHGNMHVGTYDFHTWRVRSKSRGLIVKYTGPSTIVTITSDGYFTEKNTTLHSIQQPQQTQQMPAAGEAAVAAAGDGVTAAAAASAGRAVGPATAVTPGGGDGGATEPGYRQRGAVLGMPIWAFDCVSDAAVTRLSAVVGSMLAHSPASLRERLVAGGGSFAIFGSGQVVSDVPAHRFMRYNTGRDLDKTARGLGATPTVPVTSCGEENLTMQGDRWYPCQSILVHEVGHMIHNMALGPEGVAAVLEAYRAAVKTKLYPAGCYMVTNEQEYWAVAVESWFESTVRDDVNGGIRTRAALRKHDPTLAALLEAALGDSEWRYWKDCPKPLAMPSQKAAATAVAGVARGSAAAAAAAAAPATRSRRPTRLVMEAVMEAGHTSAGVRLLLRRLLCRRFLAVRNRVHNRSGSQGQGQGGGLEPHGRPAPSAGPRTEGVVGGPTATASASTYTYTPPPLPTAAPEPEAELGSGRRKRRLRAHALPRTGGGGSASSDAGTGCQYEVPPPLPLPLPDASGSDSEAGAEVESQAEVTAGAAMALQPAAATTVMAAVGADGTAAAAVTRAAS